MGINETFWHLPSFSLEDVYFSCQLQGKKPAVKTDRPQLSGAFVWYYFDGIPMRLPKEHLRSQVRNTGNIIFFFMVNSKRKIRVTRINLEVLTVRYEWPIWPCNFWVLLCLSRGHCSLKHHFQWQNIIWKRGPLPQCNVRKQTQFPPAALPLRKFTVQRCPRISACLLDSAPSGILCKRSFL